MLEDQASNTAVVRPANHDDLKIADAVHFTETRLNAEKAPTLPIMTTKAYLKKAVLVQLLMNMKNAQSK